jgi:DNA ligase-1
MKREFLQLAHVFSPQKDGIGGWYYSEKLDGERAFWDGGISRGIPKSQVPYANCLKDDRYKVPEIATGLWSRYGNVIHASDWFLAALPKMPLDGELYVGGNDRISRQRIHSYVKTLTPINEFWKKITYVVFDSPPFQTVFANGIIDTTNFKKTFFDIHKWVPLRDAHLIYESTIKSPFCSVFQMMQDKILGKYDGTIIRLHDQYALPLPQHLAIKKTNIILDEVVASGGEGLIIRNPHALYVCERTHNMLKVKPYDDMEGTVTGYITGRETELGSKLLGMMGALVLKLDSGIRLELSGFTDAERQLFSDTPYLPSDGCVWAVQHPGQECPDWITNLSFPRGSSVTFKYRGLSDTGVPLEARYYRRRE